MERLWFTIYTDDDEAEQLWLKCGVRPDRILRCGEKDNFWSMGETGPCGPCSEIHYFTGADMADNTPDHVNSDDDNDQTTVEIWNLVFMQYEREGKGGQTPLPKPSIDTGMGFERLCRVLQGGASNYDTDLFQPVFDCIQELAGHSDAQRNEQYVAYRVIADHVRAASFLIGDGVLPGNEGRNYVLRMVMRRAMRYGRKIGFTQPFLYQVCQAVIEKMGGYYTDLVNRKDHITNTIKREEEGFARTLEAGLERLDAIVQATPAITTHVGFSQTVTGNSISGQDAFKLYDTYGLPLEITRDVAKERGFSIDEAGFEKAREAAKEIARSAGKENFAGNFDQVKAYREAFEALKSDGALPESGVRYDPYGTLEMITGLVGILRDGEMTDHAVLGETVEVILHDTPFYVESGGQVSDTGEISNKFWRMNVLDTRRPAPGFVVHTCQVSEGAPRTGDPCVAYVDKARRASIKRNHTATHLLQKCLRTVLGAHVGQQGSLVAPDRLRFDFSHSAAMTRDEIEKVSDLLNDAILQDMPVWAQEQSYKEAIASGAMAFFSEKYGDVVRVVRVGFAGDDLFDPEIFSAELCGGTHVKRTGEIGSAVVVSESAVAAGVRRIEVLTGKGALEYARKQSQQIAQIAHAVNATSDTAAEQVNKVTVQLSEAQKQLEQLKRAVAKSQFDALLKTSVVRRQTSDVLIAQVQTDSSELLREMSDWFREKHPSGVVVLGAVIGDKPSLVVSVSQDLTKKGFEAGKLIKEIAAVVGGGGGGKPTLAYAGGKDASKLGEALAKAEQLLAGV